MAWYIPGLIFLARICDVSIGTVRMMVVIAGHKFLATALGFVEVIIWVLAVGGALRYLSNPFALLGYAAGFATGTLVGMWIEQRMAIGHRVIQIISPRTESEAAERLRASGHRVTSVEGRGRDGPVELAFLVVKRRHVPKLLEEIRVIAPSAFVTIERVDPLHVKMPPETRFRERPWQLAHLLRK